MTTYSFQEVSMRPTKTARCSACGKRRTRTMKFWQTMSPFNVGKDGLPKSREEITREIAAQVNAWMSEPFLCASCDGKPQ